MALCHPFILTLGLIFPIIGPIIKELKDIDICVHVSDFADKSPTYMLLVKDQIDNVQTWLLNGSIKP